MTIIDRLVKMANKLDNLGMFLFADKIDGVLKSFSAKVAPMRTHSPRPDGGVNIYNPYMTLTQKDVSFYGPESNYSKLNVTSEVSKLINIYNDSFKPSVHGIVNTLNKYSMGDSLSRDESREIISQLTTLARMCIEIKRTIENFSGQHSSNVIFSPVMYEQDASKIKEIALDSINKINEVGKYPLSTQDVELILNMIDMLRDDMEKLFPKMFSEFSPTSPIIIKEDGKK